MITIFANQANLKKPYMCKNVESNLYDTFVFTLFHIANVLCSTRKGNQKCERTVD